MASGTITMVQASDTVLPLRFVLNSAAVDISSASEIKFAVFETVSSTATAQFSKKYTSSQITIPNGGTDGRIEVIIAAANTSSMNPGNWEYQLQVTIGSNNRLTRAGTFTLLAGASFSGL